MEERRHRWIFPFLVGTLTGSAAAGVLAIFWALISLAGSSLWDDERVALGRVGTHLLLRGILPAGAACLAAWVGLASARNRSIAPHVPILAVFVLAVGASHALLGLPELQAAVALSGSSGIPLVVSQSLAALGQISMLLAIGAFVQLSRTYGAQDVRQTGWLWRVLASDWVWFLVAVAYLGSLALEGPSRSDSLQVLSFAPLYAVLVLCGVSLWRSAMASNEVARSRGVWLVHGSVAFLLGVVVFRNAVRTGGSATFHLWALPSTVGTLFAVLAVAYAVFFKGAAGSNLVLRTGSLYGAAGGLVIFLFAGLEELFTSWLSEAVDLPSSFGSFGAAGTVALIVTGLRRYLPKSGLSGHVDTTAEQAHEAPSQSGTT